MARYRAVELGRDLIRGTNDGVSALITAKGAVAQRQTSSPSRGQRHVQPRSGTPFAATGSLPIWVFALITLVLGRDRA